MVSVPSDAAKARDYYLVNLSVLGLEGGIASSGCCEVLWVLK